MLASTRYRAMAPAIGLEQAGYACTVTDRTISDADLRQCAAIIFAKALRTEDVALAERANALGAPVLLDICDHMFFDAYGGGKGAQYAAAYRSMASLAKATVTTTTPLADILRDLAPQTPIEIIPDYEETPASVAKIAARARQWRPPTWRQRVRDLVLPHTPKQAPLVSANPIVAWFGNHGAPHSDFGMAALAALLPALANVAKTHPFTLLVISNSRAKFDQLFADAPFQAIYREWTPDGVFALIDRATISLMPMPLEPFTRCKSANRIVLALSRGSAVIADDFPALADFKDCIEIADWENALRRYLSDEPLRRTHVAEGRRIIAEHYAAPTVARQWTDLIRRVRRS